MFMVAALVPLKICLARSATIREQPRRARACTMPNNVISRNWNGWAKTAFKTALLCQFVRILSVQKQTSSQLLIVFVGVWIVWVAFGLSLVRRTLALCEELPPYRVIRTGDLARETLSPSDAMFTVLLYEWRLFGGGWLFRLMARKYLVRPCPRPRPCPCHVRARSRA